MARRPFAIFVTAVTIQCVARELIFRRARAVGRTRHAVFVVWFGWIATQKRPFQAPRVIVFVVVGWVVRDVEGRATGEERKRNYRATEIHLFDESPQARELTKKYRRRRGG